jgi:hypothetical protein
MYSHQQCLTCSMQTGTWLNYGQPGTIWIIVTSFLLHERVSLDPLLQQG